MGLTAGHAAGDPPGMIDGPISAPSSPPDTPACCLSFQVKVLNIFEGLFFSLGSGALTLPHPTPLPSLEVRHFSICQSFRMSHFSFRERGLISHFVSVISQEAIYHLERRPQMRQRPVSERKGNGVKDVADFYLKIKAIIWPCLSDMCHMP